MTIPRADHVGSLLRPPELLAARERRVRGEIDDDELRAAEDAAVDEVLHRQADCGLDVVTDGEMRRLSFQSQMVEAVDGFGAWDLDAFLWGDWKSDVVGDRRLERPPLAVESRLSRRRFLSAHEFTYARGRTDRLLKVTLPSPGLYSQFWDPERSAGAYATLEDFLWDVAEILRQEVAELGRLGATYLQLDAPHYPLLLDERWRTFYEARGSVETWLELDNHVIDAAPEGVTFGFHLCRGNQGSRWLVEGSYDALAERIFPRIRARRLLLEYDDERSGGFEPLEQVPEDTVVVLGLVTTKTPRRETPEELARRIEAASAYVPLERLALSPQCGFGTSVVGNALSHDDQWAKLGTVAETAEMVWGTG
jgi:5-methyltetrahydropteroyltriglutamate--homocysteine methyltransferase